MGRSVTMKSYITYNQNSSKNILSNTELIICHIDNNYSSTVPIFNRETIKTAFTAQRDIQNSIGSKFSNGLTITFALIKSDNSRFSLHEVNTISTWLSGNGTDQKLEIFCDETEGEPSYFYKGVFTNIQKQRMNGTIALLCTFESNSPYLYSTETTTVTTSEINKSASINLSVNCQLPIYPKITFSTSSSAINFNTINIKNTTNHTQMIISNLLDNVEYTIDLQNSIILNSYGSCNFSDIGWNNISDIHWLSLDNGINHINITVQNGICNLKIEYENKILGGVLNEFSV